MPASKDPFANGRVGAVAVDLFAARSHNAWRAKFHKANPKEKNLPRMRLRGGKMVDINQPWDKLDPRAKKDNIRAARDAYDAVTLFPDDREAAADYVHECWINRNKADKSQPKDLFKPYARLPEVEKDKDRVHVDNMKKALATVARPTVKRAKKPAKPAKKAAKAAKPIKKAAKPAAAQALSFSAADWRKFEAARKSVSAMLGRELSAEAFALVSAQAMSLLAKAGAPKPKSRRR